jgi:hypothetical protein
MFIKVDMPVFQDFATFTDNYVNLLLYSLFQ